MSERLQAIARWEPVVVLSGMLVGCDAPSPDAGAYLQNADSALSSAVSEARTAAVVLANSLSDNTTTSYANTAITDSESAIGPIEDSFGNVDPPDARSDELRDQVMSMLGDTADACASARIAVRRGDREEMRATAAALRTLADRMERFRKGLE
jgi:hypothetical protein